MPRARMLKPGFFKNEELASLPFEDRLCYAGLWTIADRDGRLIDKPKRIKAEIFPYDNVDVDALLNDLQRARFITRYAVNGTAVIAIPTFNVHQHPHPKEPESELPAPPKRAGGRTVVSHDPATDSPVSNQRPDRGEPVADPSESFPSCTSESLSSESSTSGSSGSSESESLPSVPSLREGKTPPNCAYCGATPEQTGRPLQHDHVRPKRAGGSDEPSNRAWCCYVCNQAKADRIFDTVDEVRRWLHRAYWTSNRKRWVEHRPFAFGGRPPTDIGPIKDRTLHGSARLKRNLAASRRAVEHIRARGTK